MGHANSQNRFQAFTVALIGLILIGAALIGDASASEGCSSEISKDKSGAYTGCKVTMGNREFSVDPSQSSEEGCSQVCGILAEVNSPGPKMGKTAQAARALYE